MTFTFQQTVTIVLWANIRTTSARANVLTVELGPIVDPLGLLRSLDHADLATILSLVRHFAVHVPPANTKIL
jgi:hypothetical protein